MKRVLLFLTVWLTYTLTAEETGFLAISDTHVGPGYHYPDMQMKTNLIPMMKQYIENTQNNIKTVLICGDLTTGGGKEYTTTFENVWWAPLKESADKVGAKIALAPGNHDWDMRQWGVRWSMGGVSNTPMIDFIIKNCVGLSPICHPWSIYYSFDIGGVHFACPGVYPSEGNPADKRWGVYVNIGSRKWLERDLDKLPPNTPTILFYHYPIFGYHANKWKKSEKEAFIEALKEKNIVSLIVGHSHWEDSNTMPNGAWEINVSGQSFLYGSYSSEKNALTCYRVSADGSRLPMQKPPASNISDSHAAEDATTTALY